MDRQHPHHQLAPQPRESRELSVWLWYPGVPGPAGQHAPYTPGAWAGLHLSGPAGLGETSFADVRDHSYADVPVAAGQFPVVVLEPGMGLAAPQYTTLAEGWPATATWSPASPPPTARTSPS
ncbi:hypothetical protein [Sinomonas sp. P47F7]|uniref:hypothetical protein n=1 Tax=Sinomonas sp. P47F7 TaxID=3410987 RepID=UPI003BF53452